MPRRLPPYTHIPGVTPHPIRDPAGHSFVGPRTLADVLTDSTRPQELTAGNLTSRPEFLWAVELFNAGYYWEAHEAWESLWHQAGRSGPLADFLKGLIKLAAAGVKLREHNASGVERHARRARELFESVQEAPTVETDREMTRSLPRLIALAERLVHQPPPFPIDQTGKPVAAFPRLPGSITSSTEP